MNKTTIAVTIAALFVMGCGSEASPKNPDSTPNGTANIDSNAGTNTGTNMMPGESACPEDLYELEGECVAPSEILTMSVGIALEDGEVDEKARVCRTAVRRG